ncbi:MAG TPA: sugar ABC transporter permease [Syntrophobacteria bacterium]|nr:sugar ABC transporter permease [Syntrophobacteria bacterium]
MERVERTPAFSLGYVWERERFLAAVMIAPAALYTIALVGFPFVLAILYSLSDATTGDPTVRFVGLRTYGFLLQDPVFLKALQNTFVFTFASQILVLVLAKILALVLMEDFPGRRLVRFLILLPWTAPISLSVIGWLWIFDSVFSPLDWLARSLGLLGRPEALLGPEQNLYWLGRPFLAMASVVLVQTWRILPLATVILLAGLTAIPRDILDAAQVDGAGFWRRLFQVIMPLLLPVMSIAFLFGFVFTFTDMTVVYVLTRGGPINSTQVLASWAFFKGIEAGDLAQGAAIAFFLFPALAGLSALVLLLARRAEVS